jgi:Protein of unknown function (DUF2281)
MSEQLIYLQLKQLPDSLKQEVMAFIAQLLKHYESATKQAAPKRKKRFGKYRGCLQTGLSMQEIDAQLLQLRNEWERPIC